MAKFKNALRQHSIQDYVPGEEYTEDGWLELAANISSIGADTQETSEETAYYDGDGTPESEVVSVAGAYTPEGHYDSEDPALALIAGKKYKLGNGRKVWHKVVSADGKEWIGRATALDIVADGGEASEFEPFSCTIRFDSIPEETDLSGE